MFDMSQLCSKLSRRSGVALAVLPKLRSSNGGTMSPCEMCKKRGTDLCRGDHCIPLKDWRRHHRQRDGIKQKAQAGNSKRS